MAKCNVVDGFENRVSDSWTDWKEAYSHRTFCDILSGYCDTHDTDEAILEHQIKYSKKIAEIKKEIERLERNVDILSDKLIKHVDKWGDRQSS